MERFIQISGPSLGFWNRLPLEAKREKHPCPEEEAWIDGAPARGG